MYDLNGIHAFITVAAAGSIRAAARQLGIPKTTIGRRIRDLESALNVRLIQRSARSVRLTADGESYLAVVAPAMSSIAEAGDSVARVGAAAAGELRVSVPPVFGELFLAPLVARYVAKYPGVHVAVELSDRAIDFARESFDVAIRAGKVSGADVVQRRIGRDETVHVASPGYLERHGVPTRPTELVDHACLVQSVDRAPVVWEFRDGVRVRVRGPLAATGWGLLRAAARDGLGIARLKKFYVARDLEDGTLIPILERQAPSSNLYIVHPGSGLVPARTRAFVDLVVAATKDESWPMVATRGRRG